MPFLIKKTTTSCSYKSVSADETFSPCASLPLLVALIQSEYLVCRLAMTSVPVYFSRSSILSSSFFIFCLCFSSV